MDLSDWRERIDELDRQLVELLSARAECARAVGQLKRANSLATCDPNRETSVLEHVARLSSGALGPEALRRIFSQIIAEMRAVQDAERTAQQIGR